MHSITTPDSNSMGYISCTLIVILLPRAATQNHLNSKFVLMKWNATVNALNHS